MNHSVNERARPLASNPDHPQVVVGGATLQVGGDALDEGRVAVGAEELAAEGPGPRLVPRVQPALRDPGMALPGVGVVGPGLVAGVLSEQAADVIRRIAGPCGLVLVHPG